MRYIKGLDTLRALAVLIVIYSHWGPFRFKPVWLKFLFTQVIPPGVFGVDIFFVLSGYLITLILLKARREQPGEPFRVIKTFYIRRALRIFPLYFLLILTVAYWLNDSYVQNHAAFYLTYTTNFLFLKAGDWKSLPHTWSLAVEEQFYLIWPWLLMWTPQKYLSRLILAIIAIGIASEAVLYFTYGAFGTLLLPPCFVAFGAGAYYGYINAFGKSPKRLIELLKILVPVSVLLLVIHQMIYPLIMTRALNSIIGLGVIVYIVNQNYNAISKAVLQNNFLIWMGKISYGIYLIHFSLKVYYRPFITYLQSKSVLAPSIAKVLNYIPLAYAVNFMILLLICGCCYRFIETPFLNLKKYFTYGNSKKNMTVSAVAIPGNRPE